MPDKYAFQQGAMKKKRDGKKITTSAFKQWFHTEVERIYDEHCAKEAASKVTVLRRDITNVPKEIAIGENRYQLVVD